jgi:aminoglycoside 6'-N-acetyltransferase I
MIREATIKDFKEWLRMRMHLYPEYDTKVLHSEIESILRNKSIMGELDYVVFVYEYERSKLSGFIETSIRKELLGYEQSHVGYIESLYVDPSHRRKGIARRLVELSEHWVNNQKNLPFYVDTDSKYEDAIKFYTSIGFKEIYRDKNEIIFKK